MEDGEARIIELEGRLAASQKAAREQSDAAKLFQGLFDNVPVAVTIRSVHDQSFLGCNRAALTLFRAKSVDELGSTKPYDLAPPSQPDGTPSLEAMRYHLAQALEKGFHQCEWASLRLDGSVFSAEIRISISTLEGGRRVMQTIIEDVTERREAEAARQAAERELRASEERYRQLVERTRFALLVFSVDGRVQFANPAAAELSGYSVGELQGRIGSDLLVPEELPRFEEAMDSARRGEDAVARPWRVRRKDGSIRHVESTRTVLRDSAGQVVGAQIIVADVTERRRTDELRQAAQAELTRATNEAQAASRAKSAFCANMSHELRTPLNGVIGMVELLSHTDLDARQRRYLEVALTSAKLLLSVINDVLDFSKIEAGRFDLERIDFFFEDVIEEVTTMLEQAAHQRGLRLSCKVDRALDGPLVGDPSRIRQVLVNLMTNAIKFTTAGEVVVTVSRLDVEAAGTTRVSVEVRDTGPGIARDAQDRLFKPFSQLESSDSRMHRGTGLGLAICRQLVRRMGGEIGVESSLGRGARFWFTLTLERAKTRAARKPSSERLKSMRLLAADDNATNREVVQSQQVTEGMTGRAPATSRSDRGRILVVEDTPANAEVVCEILKLRGHEVHLVTDGLQAVETIRRTPFDLVLMDCQLPGIDGYEATRRVRALEAASGLPGRAGKRLPIFALTASATVEDLTRVIDAGMDRHISKPIDAHNLIEIVAGAVQTTAPRQLPAVVDLDKALERLLGNRDLLSRLIVQFRTEAHKASVALRAAVERRELVAVAGIAHRLRGQALIFDAEALVGQVTAFERAAQRGAWDDVTTLLVRVREELDQLLDVLTHVEGL